MNDAVSNLKGPRLKHRWWARFRAAIGGYFFLPCPICGEMFGGHEWKGGSIYPYPGSPGHGVGICPACNREGRDETDSQIYKMAGVLPRLYVPEGDDPRKHMAPVEWKP